LNFCVLQCLTYNHEMEKPPGASGLAEKEFFAARPIRGFVIYGNG
jgi:hypothetical protein